VQSAIAHLLKVKVGLYQGSTLSPFLFTEGVRKPSPWQMLLGDHIVLCSDRKEELEADLEDWRQALESNGGVKV